MSSHLSSDSPPIHTSSLSIDKRFIHIQDRLILVPYLPQHVPKYHGWMSNQAILQQTASEPLSLEEEYEMQLAWATDADKRTCILIPRDKLAAELSKLYQMMNLAGTCGDSPLDQTKTSDLNETHSTSRNPIPYLHGTDEITDKLIINRLHTQETGNCVFCYNGGKSGTTFHTSSQPPQPPAAGSSLSSSSSTDNNSVSHTTIVATESCSNDKASKPQSSNSTTDSSITFFCCLLCEANAACGDLGVDIAIGDVNLFFHEYFQDESDQEDGSNDRCVGADGDSDESNKPTVAEVEIMIAEESARRCGYGALAVKLLTQYAVEWLGIKRFIAKINNDNLPSLTLFQKKLNYVVFDTVECFDEVHLDYNVNKCTAPGFYPFFPTRKVPNPL